MASSSQPVPPLRIQKGTASSAASPIKNSTPRPLSELGPTAQRRNSPSYNQATKKMALNGDSSPFQSSPFTSAEGSSPHLFWQKRDPGTPNRISTENLPKDSSISPNKKQGSNFTYEIVHGNQSICWEEALYDPEHNTFGEEDSDDERKLPPGRSLHRHAKSVTFDVAPPQINEYELATPDISSIGTGSRENSYDSEEDDDEDLYYHGDGLEQDDSFDASLEDIEKNTSGRTR
ncbi:hypothetical protein EYC84_011867 [Monilinia fructicola]|uniref:Uncharacterized protein n=1 Tax=Monilinia fructicola TaxID=38448 RepID=A0A5M9J7P8_MONFR|nr:hypothetical protein EYC84_011867 [Monilinia fructicola]